MTETEKEVQPITLINPKPKAKNHSLLTNVIILALLVTTIWFGQKTSRDWKLQPVAPVATEETANHIVLEDLDNEQPMAESAPIAMPAEKKVEVTKAKKTLAKKKSKNKKKIAKKSAPSKSVSVNAQSDAYTNGGTDDLDRIENRKKYQLPTTAKIEKVRTVKATPPVPLDERDQFIPFESD